MRAVLLNSRERARARIDRQLAENVPKTKWEVLFTCEHLFTIENRGFCRENDASSEHLFIVNKNFALDQIAKFVDRTECANVD